MMIARQDDIEWIVTEAIVDEYKQVLARPKFTIPREEIARQFAFIDQFAVRIEGNVDADFPRDRKDAKFLACARAVNADYLITGDRDFSEAQQLIATRIVSAAEFAQIIGILT
jgi:putative PIN family toxin of toxin-antitoxin system